MQIMFVFITQALLAVYLDAPNAVITKMQQMLLTSGCTDKFKFKLRIGPGDHRCYKRLKITLNSE